MINKIKITDYLKESNDVLVDMIMAILMPNISQQKK